MAGERFKSTDQVNPSEPQTVLSGLDMKPTIDWYTANSGNLIGMLPLDRQVPPPFPLQDTPHFHVTSGEVSALLGLFPPQALKRSRLNTGSIIGKPGLYFAKGATSEAIKTTPDPVQALSGTAIIPSYTDNTRWQQTGAPSSDVWLFELPTSITPAVKRIIHAEGLVHEVGHTIATQAFYNKKYALRLPSGEVVSGLDFMLRFAEAAERYDPVSHYSSFYRKPGEEFTGKLPIEEELVETIAARLLGFAYSDNPSRRLDPLADRQELIPMVDDFLNAQEINQP